MRKKGSLGHSESVTYARVRARDERHQIAKNARHSFDSFWNRFPTFRSADGQKGTWLKKKEAESGICTAQVARVHAQIPVTSDQGRNNAYLNSSASSPHNDFSL
jgi:hypothetical protein